MESSAENRAAKYYEIKSQCQTILRLWGEFVFRLSFIAIFRRKCLFQLEIQMASFRSSLSFWEPPFEPQRWRQGSFHESQRANVNERKQCEQKFPEKSERESPWNA